MGQYTLILNLDKAILASGSTDKLVIARKVNNILSTVFAGASPESARGFKQLQSTNVFQWEDKYKVFCTADTGKGKSFSSCTRMMNIEVGQSAECKDTDLVDAVKKDAKFFDLEGSFAVDCVPPKLHAGAKMSVGGTGTDYATIFVDPVVHMGVETIEIQPQNEYYLFWKSDVSTEAMYALNPAKGFQISFKEGEMQKTLRWGYATMDTPTHFLEVPSWY